MNIEQFRKTITEGIPSILPEPKSPNPNVPHAPVRKDILTDLEKELALKNALGISQQSITRFWLQNLPKN